MTLSDFRIGWRLLVREPAYSLVVIAGLAVGFAACYLLLGFVHYCFTYDSEVPDNARVYVMQHKVNVMPNPTWIEFMPLPFLASAHRSGLALQASPAIPRAVTFVIDGVSLRDEVTAVDPVFPAMFGIRALEGDLQAALARPDGLALTTGVARRLFGAGPAVGRTITIEAKAFRVMAVVPDTPSNTTMPYRALAGIDSALWSEKERSERIGQWMGLGGKIYVRAAGASSAAALAAVLQDAADRSPWNAMAPTAEALKRLGHVVEVRLRSLPDAYFDTEVADGHRGGPRGDRKTVLALAAVALLILALAVSNYLNLSTVRTLRREREIGVRKAIGASAARLLGMFVAESVLVAVSACAIGMLLAWLLLPLFAELVNRELRGMFTPASLLAGLLLALAVGVAAGLYPAALALRMGAADALAGRGASESRRGLWVRRCLGMLQFGAAIALTAITLAIGWQSAFATRIDPGFDTAPLSVVTLPLDAPDPARQALREAIARLPGVAGVAASGTPIGSPGIMKGSMEIKKAGGQPFPVKLQIVSTNFFDVFQVRAVAGRLFDPARDTAPPEASRVMVINIAAVRALGFASAQEAIGADLNEGYWHIIGVAAELRDQTLREAILPTVYWVDPRQQALTLRASSARELLHQQIQPLWKRHFPTHPFELRRVQSYFDENYAQDLRLAKLLAASSLIAIAIAAFGIYVLAAYNVQRRSREIVLRKLHGASRGAIARLLGREFAALVAAGAALGLPVAALVTERYLSGFAERAPMGIWPLASALGLAALVALAATTRHTLTAMRITPALALRD